MWQRSAKNGKRWKYVCPLLLAGLLVLESVMPVPAAETGEATETAETAESWTEVPTPEQNEEEASSDTEEVSEEGLLSAVNAADDSQQTDEEEAYEESAEGSSLEDFDYDEAAADRGTQDENGYVAEDDPQAAGEDGTEEGSDTQTDLYEEGMTLPPVSVSVTQSDGEDDHEELFANYVDRLFSVDSSFGSANGSRRSRKSNSSRFSGAALTLYSELYSGISQIAAGERDSAVFTFSAEDLGYGRDNSWSAQELGTDAIIVNGEITDEASDLTFARFEQEIQIDEVIYALLLDCPYELYWYDKTRGNSRGAGISAVYRNGEWRCFTTGEYVISLVVAEEFAVSTYTADTTRTGAASMAAENAQEILADCENLSDMEKLISYKDRICELVSYNYDAAGGQVEYGNPYQLIWVFDGDMSTNVVCEGYSKAFQYLCDSTDFDSDNICTY